MNWRAWPVGAILMKASPILERYSQSFMDTRLIRLIIKDSLLFPVEREPLHFL